MGPVRLIERTLQHDRWVMIGGLALITALAWAYTIAGVDLETNAHAVTGHAGGAAQVGGETMAAPGIEWTLAQAWVMLAMWWIMMVAMMLPSAAPAILLAAELNRRSRAERPPFGATGAFAGGYLLVWLFFSVVAVAAQYALQVGGLLSPMMQGTSKYLTGSLLLVAGLWQLTPVKRACLRHCRSPVEFLTSGRRPGNKGALLMGAAHGVYCVGCCWVLMALLFAGGVMNPYWIVALTLYVLVEKLFPRGEGIAQIAGAALIVSALAVFAG